GEPDTFHNSKEWRCDGASRRGRVGASGGCVGLGSLRWLVMAFRPYFGVLLFWLQAAEVFRALQVIEVEDAIEVIYFVLQDASKVPLCPDAHLFAAGIAAFYQH